MLKAIRISVLLAILFFVAVGAWLDRYRTTSWQHTVWVGAFPLNADGSAAAAGYLAGLREQDLAPINAFVRREAQRYGVALDEPVRLLLYPAPRSLPPTLAPRAGIADRMLFVLQLRWYRWRVLQALTRSRPQIALFLLYHDAARPLSLPHSLGLQRGLMGLVNLYAAPAQDAQNNVVIAHELLHTFGATDKYAPDSDAPLYPQGYADPQQVPRYPQLRAELMAGRIALSATSQIMPESLDQVLIGRATASEIGWVRGP